MKHFCRYSIRRFSWNRKFNQFVYMLRIRLHLSISLILIRSRFCFLVHLLLYEYRYCWLYDFIRAVFVSKMIPLPFENDSRKK